MRFLCKKDETGMPRVMLNSRYMSSVAELYRYGLVFVILLII